MKQSPKKPFARNQTITLALVILALSVGMIGLPANAMPQWSSQISLAARNQISALLAEKDARTPTEQKIDSNLLYTFRQQIGVQLSSAIATLQTGVTLDADQLTAVDITAYVTAGLLARLGALGATGIASFPEYRSIRAEVPISQVLTIAGWSEVLFIQPKREGQTASAAGSTLLAVSPHIRAALQPTFAARAQRVQSQVRAALAGLPVGAQAEPQRAPLVAATQGITQTFPINRSEGDVAHRANLARQTYGYIGTGVKVCVLSDGVNSLAALEASEDLPTVTVVPGEAGSGDEGSAMLEIVHDLAPGAQLFFATASTSLAGFATNIRTLRNSYHCDIILDDVLYSVESPFQLGQTADVISTTNGGIVAQAVNDVVSDGALYFSSAGNLGKQSSGSSGVWEGDFVSGGPVAAPITGSGNLLNFDTSGGIQAFNMVTQDSNGVVTLFWADPLGGSGNDYDLFLLDATGTAVIGASTNVQNGSQDPLESSPISTLISQRIVVVQRPGAADRFLHLSTDQGRLQFNKPGRISGHAAVPTAFAVVAAAVPSPAAPFSGSAHSEPLSSDGPRRHFFNPNSSAITPGNFSSTGGTVAQKPDLTAADSVSSATPGYTLFNGTSAAAPHAAAIAALLRSAKPTIASAEARTILTSAPTAIDIDAPGVDSTSGAGVMNALAALQTLGPTPVPLLEFNGAAVSEGARKNGNGVIDSGESFYMTVQLTNTTLAVATDVQVSLELLSGPAGAKVIQPGPLSYATLAAQSSGSNAATPFIVSLSPDVQCGTSLRFKITATYGGGGSNSPQVFFASVLIGAPLANSVPTVYVCAAAPQPQGIITITAAGGQGQRAPITNRFRIPLQTTVRDAANSPVPDTPVLFTGPASGAGATFPYGNVAITDVNGRATIYVAANTLLGSYTITANTRDPALDTAATFSLTNTEAVTYLPLIRR